jgi:hypothetical protein
VGPDSSRAGGGWTQPCTSIRARDFFLIFSLLAISFPVLFVFINTEKCHAELELLLGSNSAEKIIVME